MLLECNNFTLYLFFLSSLLFYLFSPFFRKKDTKNKNKRTQEHKKTKEHKNTRKTRTQEHKNKRTQEFSVFTVFLSFFLSAFPSFPPFCLSSFLSFRLLCLLSPAVSIFLSSLIPFVIHSIRLQCTVFVTSHSLLLHIDSHSILSFSDTR